MFTVAKNYSFVYRRAELAAGVQAAAVQRVRPVGQAVVKGREARGPRVAPTPIGCDASASARRANSATSNSPTIQYQSAESTGAPAAPTLVCVRVCARMWETWPVRFVSPSSMSICCIGNYVTLRINGCRGDARGV